MTAPPASRSTRYVVAGPVRHGVVAHALRLACASRDLSDALVFVPTAASGATPPGLTDAVPVGGAAFLHVTDRLLGGSPEEAADVVRALAGRATLGLSLHDVPQPAEGEAWYRRRRAAYRRIAGAATRLVVASKVETRMLAACFDDPAEAAAVLERTTVVPLPVQRTGSPPEPGAADGHTVGVLGYLYPGKGLEDVIDAAAALNGHGRTVSVTNFGAAAEGHADVVDALARRASEAGVAFRVTGYLPDAEFAVALGAAGVPVAPHRHISASASVNAWIDAGRRPVLRRSPYAEELAARLPGTVTVTDSLADAIRDALDEPASTWIGAGVLVGPSWAQAAAAHVSVMRSLR